MRFLLVTSLTRCPMKGSLGEQSKGRKRPQQKEQQPVKLDCSVLFVQARRIESCMHEGKDDRNKGRTSQREGCLFYVSIDARTRKAPVAGKNDATQGGRKERQANRSVDFPGSQ